MTRCPSCGFWKLNEFGFTKRCKCGYMLKPNNEIKVKKDDKKK